jgi:inner membrane protein involved in colicin E2 resistance
MKVIIGLLVAGLIITLVVLLPGRDDRPSDATVKQTVLTHVGGSTPLVSPNLPLPEQWVEEVEVISHGEPYTTQISELERTVWPITVHLTADQHKELKQVDLYRDESRQWQLLLVQDAN